MEPLHTKGPHAPLREALTIDCAQCRGLCCTALYFAKAEGFPADKPSGVRCSHLMEDYRCEVHHRLKELGLKGCLHFDCQGAGQRASALPLVGEALFAAFDSLRALHQMLWYLTECASLQPAESLWDEVGVCIRETQALAALPPTLDIESHRDRVNGLLKRALALTQAALPRSPVRGRDFVGKNLRNKSLSGADFTMALLIAADLSGCSLFGASLLGADLRDADLSGADLRESLFLTQGQVNSARGDEKTRLPAWCTRPSHW